MDEFGPDHIILPELHPPMYLMHKYWARKPHNIVASYIKKYSKEGDIVLDPFCGSGVTIAESLILGRNAIGIDINPFSIFLTKNTISVVDIDLLKVVFDQLQQKIERYPNFYETNCPFCNEKIKISHLIWKGRLENDGNYGEIIDEIRVSCKKCKIRNFPIDKDKFKSIYDAEFKKVNKIKENFKNYLEIWNLHIPQILFTYKNGKNFRQLRHKLIQNPNQYELFSLRNILILAIIMKEIENLRYDEILKTFIKKRGCGTYEEKCTNLKNTLLLTFTANLGQSSKMVWVISKRKNKKLEKKETGSWTHHFFWNPGEFFEIDPWRSFKTRFQKIIKGKLNLTERLIYKVQHVSDFKELKQNNVNKAVFLPNISSENMPIPDSSIDYIFADPPYGDSIQYFELSRLWNGWLDLNHSDHETREIIINSKQEKSIEEYRIGLKRIFSECYRVLKPDKIMTVTFHNTDIKVRNTLISVIIESKFRLESLIFQMPPRKSLKSYLHYNHSPVGDYYIKFSKKPNTLVENQKRLIDSEVKSLLKEFIFEVFYERGESTPGLLLFNFIDEYLAQMGFFTLDTGLILEMIREMVDNGSISISDNNLWWFGKNIKPVLKKKPLSKRIEIFIGNNRNKLFRGKLSSNNRLNSKTTYSEFYNLIYNHFNGLLTPDRKQITEIIDNILKK